MWLSGQCARIIGSGLEKKESIGPKYTGLVIQHSRNFTHFETYQEMQFSFFAPFPSVSLECFPVRLWLPDSFFNFCTYFKKEEKRKKHIYTLTSLCTLEKKQDIGTTKSSLCQEPLFYAFHHLFLCQIKFTFGYRISSRLDQKVYKDVFHQHLLFLPNVKV